MPKRRVLNPTYAGYIGIKSGFSLLEVCVLININVNS